MEQKIIAIEKGWGQGCTYFTTSQKTTNLDIYVDEIKQEAKQVGDSDFISVYRGYKDGEITFEMGASIDVTVFYK